MSQHPLLRKFDKAWKVQSFGRFLIPIIILSFTKLVGSLLLYYLVGMGYRDSYWMTVVWGSEGQNDFLVSKTNQVIRWLYLFLGWDSGWYLSIVTKGYIFSNQSYAFFPGLPLFGWLSNLIIHNPTISMVILSFIIGILWLPFYQAIAENYMDKSDAIKSTLLYAFFPYVFLFTTVVYAEGLFLLSTLGAWYFFKKRELLLTGIFASIAAISRPPGIFIMIPILFEILQKPKHDGNSIRLCDFIYLSLPFLCFLSWLSYCRLLVNDWIAPFTRTYWNDMYSFTTLIFKILPEKGVQTIFENARLTSFSSYWSPWIIFILLPPLIIYLLFKVEKALAVYSIAYFLGILAFGNLLSIPRFISILSLMWMLFMLRASQVKHSSITTLIICISFFSLGIFLWYGFLNGEFIS